MEEVPIRPAATVILVRDGASGLETLLLRRASSLVFHGGAWVFPGGRLDEDDYVGAEVPAEARDPRHEPAARRGAVREAYEEAGLRLEPEALIPYSHWTTPLGRPRRFATWFYLAEATAAPVTVDGGEITAHRWLTPTAALDLREAGEIDLAPPTLFTLARLADHATAAAAVHDARTAEYQTFAP